MKKMILALTVFALLLSGCQAETVHYTATSVASCAQTSAMYSRFYESGALSVVIPGLAEGLVPQGISYMPEENWLLFAGYRSDKGNSALIAVDAETGEIQKTAYLHYADGTDYNGHAGGVCATETDIYLSNAHTLYRVSLSAFRSISGAGDCRFEEEIPVPVNASYCCYAEGILWVGEFQYGGDYPTDASHRVTSADGIQRAWTCGYRMEGRADWSRPDYVLSMTERIQGVTTKDGKIYLSQSYGRKNDSVLYRYANVLDTPPSGTVTVNGAEVPLWILDSKTREDALICPPMTECLCTVGESVLVLFESAAESYMNPKNPSVNPMDRVFELKDF